MLARRHVLLSFTALVVWLVDQCLKFFLFAKLRSEQDLYSGLWGVTIHLVRNEGIAFGLPLGGSGLLIALICLLGFLFWLYLSEREGRGYYWEIACGGVFGGAVANITDRLYRGAVIDYIDFGWFPVFNVADIAIVSGIVVVLLFLLFAGEKK